MTDQDKLELVRQMLLAIGEDPDRPGLKDTPRRVVKSWGELFRGYQETPKTHAKVFQVESEQLVVLRGCEFFSFCEHHMMPFYGTVGIGYISRDKVLGLSKLARITSVYARRLQIQERMTEQIADAVDKLVSPKGVAVIVDGTHTCMSMRGVNKQRARMTTSAVRGVFLENAASRSEVISLLRTRTEHE